MTDKLRDAADAALSIIDVLRHQQPNSQILRAVSSMLREALAEQTEQDAAGLLHDKAHTDTGKTRAAQSVRTPEMSYRPGSLRMEDAPVAHGVYNKKGKIGFVTLYPDEYPKEKFVPLFTRPQPLRELGDEEIQNLYQQSRNGSLCWHFDFARAIIDAARKA